MARASTAPTIAVAMVHVKVLVAAVPAFASRYGRRPATVRPGMRYGDAAG
jgi:hypothetical protein